MLNHRSRGRRLGRRLFTAGAAAALATGMLAVGTPGANAETPQSVDVDPAVYADVEAEGSAGFFVYLADQHELTKAPINRTSVPINRTEAANHVYQTLTAHAEHSQADLRAMLEARGADYASYWIANTIWVNGDRALLDELAGHPDVSHIEADRDMFLIEPTPADDPGINVVEWGIANINADDVWADFDVRGEGITVANIDTGVRYTHNAVVNQYRGNLGGGNFDHNYNWFDPTGVCGNTPCDNNNHGTHTMGTMVGDDGGGNQIGVAPEANWIAAKGCASSSCSSQDLLDSGQWMVAPTDLNGQNPDPSLAPHVVNNSWGGGRGDTWYQSTINSWINAGIFPMFAAGNSGPNCNTANSPGDNIPAYAVGAYDSGNSIASFSSRGPSGVDSSVIKPNISAPGVDVRSATAGSDGSYQSFNGTSMATPHASGVVALVWSAAPDFARNVDATKTLLNNTARDTSNSQCGGTDENNNVFGEGRIDAWAAVNEATGGEPPPPPPTASFEWECDDDTLTCTFDGSGSSSEAGDIVAWDWDFGDGNTGSGEVVTHTYAEGGAYSVTLEVTDSEGGTDDDTQRVTVGPLQPPEAAFTHSCTQFFVWLFCSFDGSGSSSETGEIVSWDWDFGDGNTGSGETTSHVYVGTQTRDVTLTVTDDAGLSDSVTHPVP